MRSAVALWGHSLTLLSSSAKTGDVSAGGRTDLTCLGQKDVGSRLAALRRGVQVAADAVAEVTAGPRGVGKQRLQLHTSGGQRQTLSAALNPPAAFKRCF